MERGRGIEEWVYDHQEQIDFWCFIITLMALFHLMFVGAHYVLSQFLGFTGLIYPVYVIVALAAGRTAALFWSDHKRQQEERDEHEVGTDT